MSLFRNLLGPMATAEWVDHAVCSQTDPEVFTPEKGGSTRQAKRVCGGCPVQVQCLEFALEHNIRDSIWGGLSARERQQLRRDRRTA